MDSGVTRILESHTDRTHPAKLLIYYGFRYSIGFAIQGEVDILGVRSAGKAVNRGMNFARSCPPLLGGALRRTPTSGRENRAEQDGPQSHSAAI